MGTGVHGAHPSIGWVLREVKHRFLWLLGIPLDSLFPTVSLGKSPIQSSAESLPAFSGWLLFKRDTFLSPPFSPS